MQLLTMESERFSVPELLFSPAIVGLQQAGIAEAAWQGLRTLHEVRSMVVYVGQDCLLAANSWSRAGGSWPSMCKYSAYGWKYEISSSSRKV
jgi:hypothetical protein